MDLLTTGVLENVSPVMRRYKEMVRVQEKPRYNTKFDDRSSYLGAPIRSGLDMIGISFLMRPAPDYVPIWELEHMAKREFKCTLNLPCLERIESRIGDVRRHGTFMNCHEIVYFPMIYGRFSFPTELGKYLWSCHCTQAKPDIVYLTQLRKFLQDRLKKLFCPPKVVIRPTVLRNQEVNHLYREQKHVNWISAENTQLLIDDGLRILLAISITCGLSLKILHLWYFFCDGALPVPTCKEMSLHDPYISYKTVIDDNMINYMFFSLVMRDNYSIPRTMRALILHVAFYCLEHLEILSVEYRYLAGGQGESLLYLGCLRNGTLRELNILYTHSDHVEITKRYVGEAVWKKAYKLCPCLRINFVAPQVKTFNSVIPVLVMCMPLEGFYASTGLKSDNATILVNRVATTLVTNFKKFLKKVNLHLTRPSTQIDHLITKLLMDLPFLEEFIYRGPLDSISSLHIILEYIENTSLKDPCNPEPYIKAMSEIYHRYEPVFIGKGIDFRLETCQC